MYLTYFLEIFYEFHLRIYIQKNSFKSSTERTRLIPHAVHPPIPTPNQLAISNCLRSNNFSQPLLALYFPRPDCCIDPSFWHRSRYVRRRLTFLRCLWPRPPPPSPLASQGSWRKTIKSFPGACTNWKVAPKRFRNRAIPGQIADVNWSWIAFFSSLFGFFLTWRRNQLINLPSSRSRAIWRVGRIHFSSDLSKWCRI